MGGGIYGEKGTRRDADRESWREECKQEVSNGDNRVTGGIQEVRFREKGELGGMQGGRHGDKGVPGRV
jgi:hypothetical protein